MDITQIYFSPSGTTKKISKQFVNAISAESAEYDILIKPIDKELLFSKEQLLVVTMPVFAGRIPSVCLDSLAKIKGSKTPAVAMVSYGNRDYDDALLELHDILTDKGFIIIAAAAIIAQHSMFSIAKNRPDMDDLTKINDFAVKCKEKYLSGKIDPMSSTIKGNRPYCVPADIPLKPISNYNCNKCGICVDICPVNAISSMDPLLTDTAKCITCTACIACCQVKARNLEGSLYDQINAKFIANFSKRLEPDIYY